MHTHTLTCTCIHTHTHMHIHTLTHMHTHTHMHTNTHTHTPHTTHTHTHTHTYTHTHTHSGFTSVAAYLLTREVWNSRAGLLAACFMAIVPGYISRSVAGSYDNEGIAIFALLFTYFLWLKSVKTGSVFWSVAASISYFYMVGHCRGGCVCVVDRLCGYVRV